MRWTLLLATLLAGLIPVTADARPDSRRMSCYQVQDLVARRGAVVINTGRHTFERLVSSARYCQPGQIIENYWVPTRDRRSCLAGYICKEYEPRFRFDD